MSMSRAIASPLPGPSPAAPQDASAARFPAAVELHQQPAVRVADGEEGCVEAVQNVDVLGDRQHVVGHPQEGTQLPDECGRVLVLSEKPLQCLSTDAPVFAELDAPQTPLLTPAVDRHLTPPEVPCDLLGAQQVLLFMGSLVHASYYYSPLPRCLHLWGRFRDIIVKK